MSEQKDLVERLGEVILKLPASFLGPVVEARAEIEQLRERVSSQANTINTLNVERGDAVKAAKDLQEDNDALRDRLFTAELHLAHLQGYRERVNEFDPVSDRDQYEDRLPRPRRGNDNYRDACSVTFDQGGVAASAPGTAWYRRRRA